MPLEEFWAQAARERVTWFSDFETVLEWEAPYAKWFLGGTLNVCFNCVDRHVEAGRGDRVAFHFEGEPEDDRAPITYQALLDEVVRVANGLKALGVGKGTPVGIYMGMVPSLPVAMLACARLGAPHTVVFGGFSADSLSGRLTDMECEVVITQDEGWRRGQRVPLKANVDEALEHCPAVRKVVVAQRTMGDVSMTEGRDVTWSELVDGQPSDPASCPCEPMDSEDLLYLLYTSGTTAKPKGIVHTTGGYLVGVATTHHEIFDLKRDTRRLLVRRRHRLGHRPQLHRLRAALQRRLERPLRGHAGLPGPRPLVGDRRALRRDDPLHRADGDPRAHEVGAGARAEARPLLAPAARARSASRSTPRRGCGTTSTSAASAARSSTRGGRRRRG